MGYIRNDIRDFSNRALTLINDNFRALWQKVFGNIDVEDVNSQFGKKLDISENETVTEMKSADGSMQTQITQNANSIALKVNTADMASEITQNAGSVKVAVGQLGGSQLIKNSAMKFGVANWNGTSNFSVVQNVANTNTIQLGITATSNKNIYQYMYGLKPNTKYICHYDVTTTTNCSGLLIKIYGQTSAQVGTGANTYPHVGTTLQGPANQHGVIKFTTASDEVGCYISIITHSTDGALAYAYVKDLKMEEGENETAWSPNANELKNASMEVSDSGVLIKNGSLTVQDANGNNVMEGGSYKSYVGNNLAIAIQNYQVKYYDSTNSSANVMGTMFGNQNGLCIYGLESDTSPLALGTMTATGTCTSTIDIYSNKIKAWFDLYLSTGAIATSDRNSKNTINPLDSKAVDFIMALNPVSYKLNDGTSGRTHYGMVSQDVEDEMEKLGMASTDFAGFVKYPKVKRTTDKNGKITEEVVEGEYQYGLRYEEFIAPLIKTVQMQNQKIQDLEARIVALESKTL